MNGFYIFFGAHELKLVEYGHVAFGGDFVCCYAEEVTEVGVSRADDSLQEFPVVGVVEELHGLGRYRARSPGSPVAGDTQHVGPGDLWGVFAGLKR